MYIYQSLHFIRYIKTYKGYILHDLFVNHCLQWFGWLLENVESVNLLESVNLGETLPNNWKCQITAVATKR